jgi:hypothetical protein
MNDRPPAIDWSHLVADAVATRGSLAEVVRTLYDLHGHRLPEHPETVERGLRRLRKRGHAPADKYGRLLLRSFGLPESIRDRARALGTYHHPLMDLPLAERAALLRLWDRPPVLEAAEASWIHLGLASVAHHGRDWETVDQRLVLAELGLGRAGPEAHLEWGLFRARRVSDTGGSPRAQLQALVPHLDAIEDPVQHACYHARILDQLAYDVSRDRDPVGLVEALALREQIPEHGPPFVQFKRALGLAWTRYRLDRPDAVHHARHALAIAGDAGLLRLRAGALDLLARLEPEHAETYRRRRAGILERLG